MRKIMQNLKQIREMHSPTDLVVVSRTQSYSYEELDYAIDCLTKVLKETCKAKYRQCIGIYMGRKADYIPAVFSVINADGAFVPLDTKSPVERIKFIIEECNMSCILAENTISQELQDLFEHKYVWNDMCILYNIAEADCTQANDDLLYCIYTSGSTGVPKGVMLGEKGILNLVEQTRKEIYSQFSERIHVGVIAPFNFDFSILQIFPAILLGHILYIADNEQRVDGRGIVGFINECDIRVIDLTPSHIELVCMSIRKFEQVNHEITIISSGEELKKVTAQNAFQCIGSNLELINFYGPTECTVEAVIYHVEEAALENGKDVPIGKPIGNTRCYILDEEGKTVAQNEKGELGIAGCCVGLGYRNREEETERSFVTDPYFPEEKMYRTGDIAYYDKNGLLHYLGRNDSQVKVNGFRIELGEIENSLNEMPEIERSCVICIGNDGEDKKIIAMLCEKSFVEDSEIKAFLEAKIPKYMFPSEFIRKKSFPLNSNGKINRKALKEEYEKEKSTNENNEQVLDEYGTQGDDIQFKIILAVRKILNLNSNTVIDAKSSFLALGGDSLKLFALLCELYEMFSVELELAFLYSDNTIEGITAEIKKREKYKQSERRRSSYEKSPLTVMEHFFVRDNASDKMLLYLECVLKKKIDREKLKKCFQTVFENQSVFQSIYYNKGQSSMRIQDRKRTSKYRILLVEDEVITEKLLEESDLKKESNLYVEVFIGDKKSAVLFDHMVMDISSGKLLIQQAFEYYVSVKQPKMDSEYYPYSYEQKSYLCSEEYADMVHTIAEHYTEKPEYDLKNMFSHTVGNIIREAIELQKEDLERISILCKELNCTKFVVLLGAFIEVISKRLPYETYPIGIFNEGRYRKEQKNTLGNFAFPYPIMVKKRCFKEVIEFLKEKVSERYQFKILRMSDISTQLPEEYSILWKEFFIYTVNYYNYNFENDLFGYIDTIHLEENSKLIYPLNVNIEENPSSIRLEIAIAEQVFPQLDVLQVLEEISNFIQEAYYEFIDFK